MGCAHLVCLINHAIFLVVHSLAAITRSPSFSRPSSSITTTNSPALNAASASSMGSNWNVDMVLVELAWAFSTVSTVDKDTCRAVTGAIDCNKSGSAHDDQYLPPLSFVLLCRINHTASTMATASTLILASPTPTPSVIVASSRWSFTQGFLVGQATFLVLCGLFIKYVVFEDAERSRQRTADRAKVRRCTLLQTIILY